jgi:GTP-binding protein EngB required for normal cell division
MATMIESLETNMRENQRVAEEVQRNEGNVKELNKSLNIQYSKIVTVQIDFPRTVCCEAACVKKVLVGGENGQAGFNKTVYSQICHNHCYIPGVEPSTMNDERLRNCAAMGGQENCVKCGHNYRSHMHKYYDEDVVQEPGISKEVQDEIKKIKDGTQKKQGILDVLTKQKKKFESELEFIKDYAARFANFLKDNAMLVYNDSYNDYLDHLIKLHKMMQSEVRDDEHIKKLESAQRAHNEKIKAIKEGIACGTSHPITPADIPRMQRDLFELEINGKELKKMFDESKSQQQSSTTMGNYGSVKISKKKKSKQRGKNKRNSQYSRQHDDHYSQCSKSNQIQKSWLQRKLLKPEKTVSKEDINILILGETGVGKSTWINGVANYLQFHTLEEAKQNKFTVIIPSEFSVTDEYGQTKIIKVQSDIEEKSLKSTNESYEIKGASVTQHPMEYKVETSKYIFHLIDTPGIGDTRGVDVDETNFKNILQFLNHFEDLHGICLLLKPNDARSTVAFRFCIKELMSHLHKSVIDNMFFCFTNSRGTLYKPGETLPNLQNLLASENIPINAEEKCFCFDNEAFRFLACIKNGMKFEEEKEKPFESSWETS